MVLKKLKRETEIVLRHLEVLQFVRKNQPIGIFKLAEALSLPKHKVRYSLRVLEQSGIIEPTQHGAVLRKEADRIIKNLKREIEEINKSIEKINEILGEI